MIATQQRHQRHMQPRRQSTDQ